MTRCSHCNSDGHNNRTCSTRTSTGIDGGDGGVKLFGVTLTDGSFIKKSLSMGNIPHNSTDAPTDLPQEYHSDDAARGSHAADARRRARRKKGTPWTEEEHWKFLCGLQKLGKGNWRGISKNYVPSRTPTQVASHAQKYFIRQSNMTRRKKRSSLFDMATDMETDSSSTPELSILPLPSTDTDNEKVVLSSFQQAAVVDNSLPSLDLSLKLAFTPLQFQLWPPDASASFYDEVGTSHPQILKSIPLVQKEPAKELVGISHLTLVETDTVQIEQSSLSLRLPGEP